METNKKLIEIRPIDIEKWHEQQGANSFAQPVAIRALYDHETGGYATGLTTEETEKYSKMLGLDLSNTFNPQKAHPYWDSAAAKIKLPNYSIFLDPSIATEYIKIKVLKASKMVANSLKEYQEGKYPEATHIIFDENDEIEVKATKAERKAKCYILANKMAQELKENILAILSEKSIKGKSSNYISVQMEQVIENTPDEFLKYAQMTKEELNVRATLIDALYKNILTKEGIAIYYMNDKIANSYEDAVKYFLDPQNQQLKISILEKLV